MNDDYTDREQSQIKHFALRKYLEAASKIIGSWNSFSYVDCCAGPWESKSPQFDDTSFGIAVSVLKESKQWLKERSKNSRFRALLIEEKASPYKELAEFAGRSNDSLVEVKSENWDFRSHLSEIVDYVSNPPSFAFFFIDPTGWNPAMVEGLEPLLRTRPCEVLINFMSSFIVRFLHNDGTNMDDLLGEGYRELRDLPTEEQEDEAVSRYCDLVRKQGGFDYVCPLPVMKRDQDAIHFYLIYGTRHAKGVQVFKQVEKRTEKETQLVRALRQQSKRAQGDLFAPDVLYRRDERYRRLAKRNHEKAFGLVRLRLLEHGRITYDDCWAEALQFPTVYEDDLRAWISEMESSGSARVIGRVRSNEALKRGSGYAIVKL